MTSKICKYNLDYPVLKSCHPYDKMPLHITATNHCDHPLLNDYYIALRTIIILKYDMSP